MIDVVAEKGKEGKQRYCLCVGNNYDYGVIRKRGRNTKGKVSFHSRSSFLDCSRSHCPSQRETISRV
jgi:hypothetical protein